VRLALLGATGAVGRTMLRVLEERRLPVAELVPLASAASAGLRIPFGGREWTVREVDERSFRGCDVALFSAGAERSRRWAEAAAGEGAVVVDNSSAWRMHDGVPLVVPEVNGARVRERGRGIIANPNCSTIQLVLPLEALRRRAGLRRVLATTFQSVSGAGQRGIAALRAELAGAAASASPFPGRIAGNVIPAIGPRDADGWHEEEQKMRQESRKILELPSLGFAATCVRVPVEVGHAIAAAVETEMPITPEEASAALHDMPGLVLLPAGEEAMPQQAAGRDEVLVSRLRADPDDPRTLHLWVVADNLRKGAATNAVQIVEAVFRD
jgi:aspartate-semialdehyde dehydrogenase